VEKLKRENGDLKAEAVKLQDGQLIQMGSKLEDVLGKLNSTQERIDEGQQTIYDELLTWIKPWCESTAKQQSAVKEQIEELGAKVADPTESEAMKKMLEEVATKIGDPNDTEALAQMLRLTEDMASKIAAMQTTVTEDMAVKVDALQERLDTHSAQEAKLFASSLDTITQSLTAMQVTSLSMVTSKDFSAGLDRITKSLVAMQEKETADADGTKKDLSSGIAKITQLLTSMEERERAEAERSQKTLANMSKKDEREIRMLEALQRSELAMSEDRALKTMQDRILDQLKDLSAKVSFEAPVQQRSQGASKVRCGMAQYLMAALSEAENNADVDVLLRTILLATGSEETLPTLHRKLKIHQACAKTMPHSPPKHTPKPTTPRERGTVPLILHREHDFVTENSHRFGHHEADLTQRPRVDDHGSLIRHKSPAHVSHVSPSTSSPKLISGSSTSPSRLLQPTQASSIRQIQNLVAKRVLENEASRRSSKGAELEVLQHALARAAVRTRGVSATADKDELMAEARAKAKAAGFCKADECTDDEVKSWARQHADDVGGSLGAFVAALVAPAGALVTRSSSDISTAHKPPWK